MKTGKLTLSEKINLRKVKRPPSLLYIPLCYFWRSFYKRLNVDFTYKINPKDYKNKPYILVFNHQSRLDYYYSAMPMLPQRLNYIVGNNEFYRSHLYGIFKMMGVIPKRNFTPDIATIRRALTVLKMGGKICFSPEGMSTVSGHNQPVALGTGKFFKHAGVDVLYSKSCGAYLTTTKHCLDERLGHIETEIGRAFSAEELKNLTEDQIQDKINDILYVDDYEWNKTKRYKYDGHGQFAYHLHHMLYYCPKCHQEFTMKGEGDVIKCSNCGNGATINEYYDLVPLDDTCVLPRTPTRWWDIQRNILRKRIELDPNYQIVTKVKLGELPQYKPVKNQGTGVITGEGVLTLSRKGVTFDGVRNGQPFSFNTPTELVPAFLMVTDMSFVQTYHNSQYFEFYPYTECAGQLFIAVEEFHRVNGGKWQNFKNYDYNILE